jgi:hypothetical protein
MTILTSNNSANGIIWRTVIKPQIALIIASIDHEKTDAHDENYNSIIRIHLQTRR